MGSDTQAVMVGVGFQFLHVALQVLAHGLESKADIAAQLFGQRPQLLNGLFADEQPIFHMVDSTGIVVRWQSAKHLTR